MKYFFAMQCEFIGLDPNDMHHLENTMDPDATFGMMLEAVADNEFDFAIESANELMKWLRCGGFLPTVSIAGGGELLELTRVQSNRAIAYAVASEILLKANQALESR